MKYNNKLSRTGLFAGRHALILALFLSIHGPGCVSRLTPVLEHGSNSASGKSADRALELRSPATLKYAGLNFTVTRAVISDEGQANSNEANLDISIVNPSEIDVRISDGIWELKIWGGDFKSAPFDLQIGSRETKNTKITFERIPAGTQWTGSELRLDEKDKEPASVLLDSPMKQIPDFPLKLTSGSTANTQDPSMAYTITRAEIDLDGMGKRAVLDKRYLNLEVHVVNHDGSGQFLPEFFRLLVNGDEFSPEDNANKTTIEPLGGQEYSMSFLIPSDTANVELEVGKAEIQKTVKMAIDVRQPATKRAN